MYEDQDFPTPWSRALNHTTLNRITVCDAISVPGGGGIFGRVYAIGANPAS
jgi:hypothetical protein